MLGPLVGDDVGDSVNAVVSNDVEQNVSSLYYIILYTVDSSNKDEEIENEGMACSEMATTIPRLQYLTGM